MSSKQGHKVTAELASTLHWVLHTEVTLDYPVEKVWRTFKDMASWYTEYSFETVAGPPYEADSGLLKGQVLKLRSSKGLPRAPNSDGGGPEYFIQKTLEVVPHNEIVVVLSGAAYDWKRVTSFYVWRMTEKATRTTILIDTYGEAELLRPLPRLEFSEYWDTLEKNWHRSWSEALANLEKVMDTNEKETTEKQ
jgi:hypothetical protein